MRNIEIKAKIKDLKAAGSLAATLAGSNPSMKLRQIDTYFNVGEGRLKLREKEGAEGGAELIFYRRPAICGPKRSDYEIMTIPEPSKTKSLFAGEVGIKAVASKRREVYLVENARIHLDEVEGLGTFLEIEVVMPPEASDKEGESLILGLMEKFSINHDELLDCSYCDLMERKTRV